MTDRDTTMLRTEAMHRLQEALTKLPQLQGDLEDAATARSAASSRETAALNALNDVQKTIDEASAALRTLAPQQSDWSRAKRSRVSAETAA